MLRLEAPGVNQALLFWPGALEPPTLGWERDESFVRLVEDCMRDEAVVVAVVVCVAPHCECLANHDLVIPLLLRRRPVQRAVR